MRTYLIETVCINGDQKHRCLMHREIQCPIPLYPGMGLTFGNESFAEIGSAMFYEREQEFHLYSSSGTIFYHDQGPKELQGEERKAAFFKKWIEDMVAGGWTIGQPPSIQARMKS